MQSIRRNCRKGSEWRSAKLETEIPISSDYAHHHNLSLCLLQEQPSVAPLRRYPQDPQAPRHSHGGTAMQAVPDLPLQRDQQSALHEAFGSLASILDEEEMAAPMRRPLDNFGAVSRDFQNSWKVLVRITDQSSQNQQSPGSVSERSNRRTNFVFGAYIGTKVVAALPKFRFRSFLSLLTPTRTTSGRYLRVLPFRLTEIRKKRGVIRAKRCIRCLVSMDDELIEYGSVEPR